MAIIKMELYLLSYKHIIFRLKHHFFNVIFNATFLRSMTVIVRCFLQILKKQGKYYYLCGLSNFSVCVAIKL
jgi:hypothetical protein